MEIMNQPFTGQLGDRLIELLNSSDFHTLNITVAFAKNSGVLRLKNYFEKFRKQGGKINFYVGVDLGGTSYEALTTLRLCTDTLNVVHSETGQTFHSKIYQFSGDSKGMIIVGSHNLTGGGLWTNFESSIFCPIDKSSFTNICLLHDMEDYLEKLTSLKDSFMPIGEQNDIDKLLQNGYVFKEVAQQVRMAKAVRQDEDLKQLFGNGVPAKLPLVITPKKQKAAVASVTPLSTISITLKDFGDTIWFETKRLTGGSRNILDLSMKSLVERGDPKGTPFDLDEPGFMRGGVEFFGINPSATNQIKNIIINFEGIDYSGNSILFPVGKKANGTWRLQLKGISCDEIKITEAFRAKGVEHYLVEKIITFSKIKDDYYFMSVFPESELENFKAASRILARNGSTRSAKQLGLL